MEDLVLGRPIARAPLLLKLCLLGLVAMGCLGATEAPELSDLAADPAAKLRMPAAAELSRFRKDREMTVEGPSMAFHRFLFGTNVSGDDVFAFYRSELARLGWTEDRLVVSKGSTDIRVVGWCKGRGLTFRVAIQDPAQVVRLDSSGRQFPTVFDAGLVGVDPEQVACRG
jgi:hypothetical protein